MRGPREGGGALAELVHQRTEDAERTVFTEGVAVLGRVCRGKWSTVGRLWSRDLDRIRGDDGSVHCGDGWLGGVVDLKKGS